jgi:hypothetical protein
MAVGDKHEHPMLNSVPMFRKVSSAVYWTSSQLDACKWN